MMIVRKLALVMGLLVAGFAPVNAADSLFTKSMVSNALKYAQDKLKGSLKPIAFLAGSTALLIGVYHLYIRYKTKQLEARIVHLEQELEKTRKREKERQL